MRALSDASGTVMQMYRTDAFGIPETSGCMGMSLQPMQDTGEPRDAETGLVYLRARMYDPTLGRFMQADPRRTPGGPLQQSGPGSRGA